MTDNTDPTNTGTTETGTTAAQQATRSPALLVTGLVALVVAGWAIAGGPRFQFHLDIWPWVLIALGVVVGAGLVISGFRSR